MKNLLLAVLIVLFLMFCKGFICGIAAVDKVREAKSKWYVPNALVDKKIEEYRKSLLPPTRLGFDFGYEKFRNESKAR